MREQFEEWARSEGFSEDSLFWNGACYVEESTDYAWSGWQAALQRSRTQATEAVGYKLVPIEPTREMLEAMTLVLEAPYNQANAKYMFKALHVHQAMLKAAPPVATEHGEAYAVFRVNKYGEYSLTISDWAFANLNEFPINTEYELFTPPPQSQSVRDALEKAAQAMNPMLRDMISRGQAADIIRALIEQEGE